MWLAVLVILVYLFTTALVNKYKEQMLDMRELRITDKAAFDKELSELLEEIVILQNENEELKNRRM